MSIDLTPSWQDEELSMFRDSVSRFLEAEVVPHDDEARKAGNVGHGLWRKAGEMGLLCTDIPEEFGGAGGDFRHEAVVAEEMGKRALTGLNHSVHSIVAHYFLNHGTDEQKEKYLPRMARGELVGAIAIDNFKKFSGDKLFLAADGIDVNLGLSSPDLEEAALKRTMIKMARKVIVVADSSKFGRRNLAVICSISQIDVLITDKGISAADHEALVTMGVEVVIVD
ncbi:MAG: acyl-CoA dehydrogenase family protein [Marinobacter sp.]